MKASENKFLIVKSGVKLTPQTEPTICALDKCFEEANKKGLVTSVLRDSEDQLNIIRMYLKNKGLKDAYPDAFNKGPHDMVHSNFGIIYAWQLGWSKLLNIGLIINPPLPAICLLDYIRNGINKKGMLIQMTPHHTGLCVDLGGGDNGISDELEIVKKAMIDKVIEIRGYVIERENNCLHLDI